MATLTLNMPKEFFDAKRKYPEVDWNAVLKRGIMERLEELQKFDELKARRLI